MKKWLIFAVLSLCFVSATACRTQDDSSTKKPSAPTSSSIGEIELPEDKFD